MAESVEPRCSPKDADPSAPLSRLSDGKAEDRVDDGGVPSGDQDRVTAVDGGELVGRDAGSEQVFEDPLCGGEPEP
jgi:hypothetical protein